MPGRSRDSTWKSLTRTRDRHGPSIPCQAGKASSPPFPLPLVFQMSLSPMPGGLHLDTILVDEGFGSLDPETLDKAMNTLMDLQKGGRLVGIISHVAELKERIPAQLIVTGGVMGSHASFRV